MKPFVKNVVIGEEYSKDELKRFPRHHKSTSIGDAIRELFDENPHIKRKIMEIRIQRAWGEVLGFTIMQATSQVYVRNSILYVSVTSSTLRHELVLNRLRLVKKLNEHVQGDVITDVVIR